MANELDRLQEQLATVSDALEKSQKSTEELHESTKEASESASLDLRFVPRPEVYGAIADAIRQVQDIMRPVRWILICNAVMIATILVLVVFRFSTPIPILPQDVTFCRSPH